MARPSLSLRIIPRFPVKLLGTDGIAVTRSGGTATIRQDWTNIQQSGVPVTPEDYEFLFRDTGDGSFLRVPVQDIILPEITWDTLTGKPTTFPPAAHTHPISEVVLLQASLDDKFGLGNAGTATAGLVLTANGAGVLPTFQTSAAQQSPRGYIDGFTLSRSAATTIGFGAGTARDSTHAADIAQTTAWTKTLAAFAAGTGNGSLDTGTIANSTGYHVFAISKAGGTTPDYLISTSATAPTMPATYTLFRRIGWIKTDGSAQIIDFVQFGNKFVWKTPIADATGSALGTTSISLALSTPGGVKTQPLINYFVILAGASPVVFARSPDATDVAPSGASAASITALSQAVGALTVPVADHSALQTGTSSEVYFRASAAATSLYVATFGWIDPRGANA